MNLVEQVSEKFKEYGVTVFDHYQIPDENEYVFYTEDCMLFVNLDDNELKLALQATTKPDKSANLVLTLKEIEGIKIRIMESFIFDENMDYVYGNDAYNLIENCEKNKLASEVEKQFEYLNILENCDGFEC